jgi:hypothetical protein
MSATKMRYLRKIPPFYLKTHQSREEEFVHFVISYTNIITGIPFGLSLDNNESSATNDYNHLIIMSKKRLVAPICRYISSFRRFFSLYRRVPRIRNKLSLMDKCSEQDCRLCLPR